MNRITVNLLLKETQKNEQNNSYWYTTVHGTLVVPSDMAQITTKNIEDIIALKLKENQFDEVTIIFNNRKEEDETTN